MITHLSDRNAAQLLHGKVEFHLNNGALGKTKIEHKKYII